jgi:hypothetical protein
MNKASFRNMHSLDFIHHHMLKIKTEAKLFSEMTNRGPRAKNKGHIYCTRTNRQGYSQLIGPTEFFTLAYPRKHYTQK